MSFFIANSVNDILYTANTPPEANTLPYTMAIWGKCEQPIINGSTTHVAFGISRNTSSEFFAIGVNTQGYARSSVRMGGISTTYDANTGVQITDSEWHHYCGICESGTSTYMYIDGGNETQNTPPSLTFAGLYVHLAVGALERGAGGGRSNPWKGQLAHPVIWNVKLTAAEITKLAAGANPLTVRPESIVFYESLLVDEGAFTLIGSPTFQSNTNPLINPIGPGVKQYANGYFQSSEFKQVTPGPLKVCANSAVHLNEMVELAGTPSKLYANGTYVCPQFVEQIAQ